MGRYQVEVRKGSIRGQEGVRKVSGMGLDRVRMGLRMG